MVRYFQDMWRYTPAPAIKVEGGIKAARTKGAFASQWWGKRWIQALERSPSGARLKRGRTYARKGQVMSLHIEIGAVEAVVQGSRVKPYKVDMHWPVFSDELWTQIAAAMAKKPLMAAQLLQGLMPEDIESLFAGAGTQLLPARLGEIQSRCSCPDSANPCKHIAAVCYLLAEALDRDPFIMFKLRGIERDAFLDRLRPDAGDEPTVPNNARDAEPQTEPLPAEPELFWQAQETASPASGMARLPATNARWPKRLGTLPLWRSDRPFIKTMESYYDGASRHAEVLGERLKCED